MIGFTGTRSGMTPSQKTAVVRILERCGSKYGSLDGHPLVGHGDCKGADEEFDEIARTLQCVRHIFPSNLEQTRAHCEKRGAIEISLPAPPLTRNVWIVDRSFVLIATPRESVEVLRSGTWATIRRARKSNVRLLLVTPDGSLAP